MVGLSLVFKRCRYCKKRLWIFQSYTWDKTEQTHDYALLIRPKNDPDAYIHDGCFFEAELKNGFRDTRG